MWEKGFYDVQLESGRILRGGRIKKVASNIINELSEEKVSYEEAKVILDKVIQIVGEYSVVQRVED